MTVYVVAQFSFTDRAEYEIYDAQFMEVFDRYDGTVLAATEEPVVAEGEWAYEKIVMMSFPDSQAMRAWAGSPEYRAIAKHRRAGTDGVVLVVPEVAS